MQLRLLMDQKFFHGKKRTIICNGWYYNILHYLKTLVEVRLENSQPPRPSDVDTRATSVSCYEVSSLRRAGEAGL